MAVLDKVALFQLIDDNITTNGNEEITGAIMNSTLKEMIDSVFLKIDDGHSTLLSNYDPTKTYNTTDIQSTVMESGLLYQAKAATTNITGAFNSANWNLRSFVGIDPGSATRLNYDNSTGLLSLTALGITDVTVNNSVISLAAFVAAEYTVGDEFQEGDTIILTAATGGPEVYIQNGGAAGTVADFTVIEIPGITNAAIRALFSATGGGLTYAAGTGIFTQATFTGTGSVGSVPDPGSETGLFLKDDGTWGAAADGNGIYDGSDSLSGPTTIAMAASTLTLESSGQESLVLHRDIKTQGLKVDIRFAFDNSADAIHEYAIISGGNALNTAGAENGFLSFGVSSAGTLVEVARVKPNQFSVGNTNPPVGFQFYVDEDAKFNQKVSVNNSTATAQLDVFSSGNDNSTFSFRAFSSGDSNTFLINDSGSVGIGGAFSTIHRMEVRGKGNTSGTICVEITNSDQDTIAAFRDDGLMGVGTSAPRTLIEAGVVSESGATVLANAQTNTISVGGNTNGNVYIEGSGMAILTLDDSGGSVNERYSQLVSGSGTTSFRLPNDAGSIRISNVFTIDHPTGNVGIGLSGATSQLHIDQSDVAGAKPVLTLDQGDVSEEFIEFLGTIGVGNSIEAVAAKTLTATHFLKVKLQGGLIRYVAAGTIA